jgi:hypothetical protein
MMQVCVCVCVYFDSCEIIFQNPTKLRPPSDPTALTTTTPALQRNTTTPNENSNGLLVLCFCFLFNPFIPFSNFGGNSNIQISLQVSQQFHDHPLRLFCVRTGCKFVFVV